MSKKRKSTKPAAGQPTELVLDGEITVSCLDDVRSRFLAAMAGQGELYVRTRDLTYMDAAALQLLWALRRECSASGRTLRIEPPRDSILRDASRLGMQDVFIETATA
jgi:anti-anti-sigma factor